MLKDEQNCSYNDGEDAKPLKTWSDFSSIPVEPLISSGQYMPKWHIVEILYFSTTSHSKCPNNRLNSKLCYFCLQQKIKL